MPKRNVELITGNYYHVFNRGNNKNPVFLKTNDYERLLNKVDEYSQLYPLEIHAFCLLSNHVHFLVRQTSNRYPISKFFGSLFNSHAQYMNKRYGMVGHLVQGRFQARPLESEPSFLQASRYIHLNPIKDRLLDPNFIKRGDFKNLTVSLKEELKSYPWSSYHYYLVDPSRQPRFLVTSNILELAGGRRGYKSFVEAKITIENIFKIEALSRL